MKLVELKGSFFIVKMFSANCFIFFARKRAFRNDLRFTTNGFFINQFNS